jgi:hypothetical protein
MSASLVQNPNEGLLVLNHQIREKEHELRALRRLRWWSNAAVALGPGMLLVLYVMWRTNWPGGPLFVTIAIPGLLVAVGFCVAAVRLKFGGEDRGASRKREARVELEIARIRDSRKLMISATGFDKRVRRLVYKEDAFNDVQSLRVDSKKYRAVNNALQGVLIIGSLAATGVAGLAGEMPQMRWVTGGLTFAVGVSSGFLGYFKYKERSFYLQQTADSIESEWEALEIGVGRYKGIDDEDAALEAFSEEVHRLKSEQKKRQQNLEQAPDVRGADE